MLLDPGLGRWRFDSFTLVPRRPARLGPALTQIHSWRPYGPDLIEEVARLRAIEMR